MKIYKKQQARSNNSNLYCASVLSRALLLQLLAQLDISTRKKSLNDLTNQGLDCVVLSYISGRRP